MSRNKIHRLDATVENLFPKEKKSSLDPTKLKRLGLTKERMCGTDGNPDALFSINSYCLWETHKNLGLKAMTGSLSTQK